MLALPMRSKARATRQSAQSGAWYEASRLYRRLVEWSIRSTTWTGTASIFSTLARHRLPQLSCFSKAGHHEPIPLGMFPVASTARLGERKSVAQTPVVPSFPKEGKLGQPQLLWRPAKVGQPPDLITAEMMVGTRIDDEALVNEMFVKMLDLVQKITEHSENFIADQLNVWGFEVRASQSVSDHA